jgi:hypothetical protein
MNALHDNANLCGKLLGLLVSCNDGIGSRCRWTPVDAAALVRVGFVFLEPAAWFGPLFMH